MDQWIGSFLDDAQHRYAARSVEGYRTALGRFGGLIQARGWNPNQLPPACLDEFCGALVAEGLSASTVRTYVTFARRFLVWCKSRGLSVPNQHAPTLPRVPKSLPVALEGKTLAAYSNIAATVSQPYAAILLLMPTCGVRLKAMCRLELSHIAAAPPPVRFVLPATLTKGQKARAVPLLPAGTKYLTHYVRDVRPHLAGADSPWLFPTSRGNPALPTKVQMHMRKVRARLGLEGLTPHVLRKTYATVLSRGGIDLPEISRLLGHEQITTTMRYVASRDDDELADAVSQIEG